MLNPIAARQLIATQGERIRWFEALPCDCRDPGDPDYGDFATCGKCQHGYVYRERMLPDGVKALVYRERRQFLHADWGFVGVGELYITTMPDQIPLGNFDRVVLTERAMPKKELVRLGEDVLREEFPLVVLTVAEGDTEFVAGVDYSFDEAEGRIVWLDGGARPDGAIYTVHYRYAPVYWYTGSSMTAPRPMPGHSVQWPQTGLLQVSFPTEG